MESKTLPPLAHQYSKRSNLLREEFEKMIKGKTNAIRQVQKILSSYASAKPSKPVAKQRKAKSNS